MDDMMISNLARAGGVGVETVRYYQRRGLLDTPARSPGGSAGGHIRRYGAADLQKLRFIRAAQGAGFTLDQIAELITLDTTKDRARAHLLATDRLAALDATIAALQTSRASLIRLADACGTGSTGPCPILISFSDTAPAQGAPRSVAN